MKKNIILCLIIAAIFTGYSRGGPPADFQKGNVQVIVPQGAASPILQRYDFTVEQITKPFIEKGAKWTKLSETEWMVTLDSEDKVTNKKSKVQLVFEKHPELKGDVVLKRLLSSGEDCSQEEIYQFVMVFRSQAPRTEPAQPRGADPRERAPATPPPQTKAAHATPNSTAATAQQEAIRRYPDLGVAGSKLNTEFVSRHKRYLQERPDYFRDPSWPLRLAEECVRAIK
ncbi:MAG: hypothetical protein WCL08_10200 [Verrucomicrobiota bacterium]